jgi:23S rRNA pseudouridine1911/1915/1917 synthase
VGGHGPGRERIEVIDDVEEDEVQDLLRFGVPEDGARLDRFLVDRVNAARPELHASRALIQRWIEEGRVRTGWRPLRKNSLVRRGEVLEVDLPPPAPPVGPLEPEEIPLRVVHEDDSVIVIDKPAGLTVHPGAGQRSGTLANALLALAKGTLSTLGGPDRPGIVHRLDKDTSGLIVCARTDAAHRFLSSQFHDRKVVKRYLAITASAPREDAGTVDAPIGRSPRDRKKMAIVPEGRPAVTRWEVRERFGKRAALLEVAIETGRTHQIRVHLAKVQLPVLGDEVYGRPSELIARQALHAFRIAFPHPAGGTLAFESPVPEDMASALERLGSSCC